MHLRGHEFHWSSIKEPLLIEHTIYEVQGEKGYSEEGFANDSVVASYIHLPIKSFVIVITNLFRR
jgi:cobyrinic acid a,c-diamide synthase